MTHFLRALGVACMAMLGVATAAQGAVPSGFSEQTIDRPDGGAWAGVVGITFTPSGRGFAWERAGRVWILDSANPVPQPMLNIAPEVGEWADHGMLGFALHPNFNQNGYLYLWYVVDRHHLVNCDSSQPGAPVCNASYNASTNQYQAATIGRLTRYQAVKPAGDADYSRAVTVDYSSRRVLIGETRLTGCPVLYLSHGVGSLVFGEDGTLMASCGDAGSYALADPGSDPATYFQQALTDGIIKPKENVGAFRAQLVDSLNGKIMRVDPLTGDGVASNPFYDSAQPRSARSRVWALGFRNPFRLTRRPDTGEHDPAMGMPGVLYVGDVGWRDWEDLNIVHSGGQNFGWPLYEGMNPHAEYQAFATANQDAPNPWFGKNGCTQQFFRFKDLIQQDTLASPLSFPNPCRTTEQVPVDIDRFLHARPLVDWKHGENNARWAAFNGDTAEAPQIGQSNTEGSWTVQGTPFAGNASTGGTWYTGTAFPAEYRNTYFHADYGAQWIRKFVFNANDFPVSVDVFNPSAGGIVAMAENPADGSLYYIVWASFIQKVTYGSGVNRPPVAVASSDVQFGASPLTVAFRGDLSSDPDGTSITYSWDFGDGSPISSLPNPSHTYVASGPQQFVARLTVTDPGGLSSQASVVISPNNTPPTVSIVSPLDGWLYPMGAAFSLSMSAIVSDSQSPAAELSCQWQIFLHHNYNHTHEDPPINGCQTQATLTPIGCGEEIYFYEARLRVTDPQGLVRQRSSFIYPDCPANQAPVAAPDSAMLQIGTVAVINVLANDTDDGSLYAPSVAIVSPPQHGIATVNSTTGAVTYSHSGDAGSASDSFTYFVRDTIGKTSNTALVSISVLPPDAVPPTVPGSLSATARGSSRVDLAWAASTDTGGSGLAGYRVYRNGSGTPVATLAAGTTAYTDYGLTASTTYTYQVTAFDNANNESGLSSTATATTGAAGTWTGQNIGAVGIVGNHAQSGSNFTLQASGADVWGTSDQFYFVHQRLSGDGEIRVRVTGLQNTSPWAKAGVMIRESLAVNSKHAMAIITPERGAVLQYRTATGGSSGPSGTTGTGVAPEWLRLVRAGNTFTAFKSEDGQAWTQIGQVTITMGATPYIGLMLSSLNNTTLNTATYAGANIAGPAPVVDTTAPSVPAGLQVTSAGTTSVSLGWTASTDTGGSGLVGYRVYRNGGATPVAQVTTGTTYTDGGLSPNTAYSYQVAAYDGSNNESAKSSVVNTTTLAAIATPDVVGQTQADAQGMVLSSGLTVGTVGFQYSTTVPATYVISQSPAAGSLVTLGSVVDLVVSQGLPPEDPIEPTVPGSLSATARGSSRVDLAWAASTDTGGSGLAGYRVYRDGSGTPVATLAAGATAYTDYGLTGSTTYAYQVTAFDNANNESTLSAVATAITSGAGTWTGQNIGAVGIAGNHAQSGSSFTLQASGADVWGNSDQFYFVHQRLSGDGEIRVRVTGLQNTAPWAKAGVMIRESLAVNSKHAMAIITPERGAVLQYRTATGGSSGPSGTTGTGVAPEWLRLVRAGNTFTAFKSEDGQAWTQIGQVTITMGATPYIGLMLSSLNNTTLNTATYEMANTVGTSGGAADTQAPTVPQSFAGSIATLGSLAAPVSTALRSNPHSVVADDVNGDGKDDLILAVAGDNSVAVLLGQGGGVFGNPTYLPAGTKPKYAVTGDFNRDGKRDIVSADQDSASISLMLGNGNGTFQTRSVYASCDGNHEIAVADLDRDQRDDVVTVCHREPYTIAVFLGNGDGTLQPRVNLSGAGRTNGVAIRDLNNDLFNDLIVTNNDVALVSVLLGKGDGTFEAPVNYATGAGPHSVRVGDVNGDGKLDLVTANDVSASMTVLLGTGAGTFTAGTSYPTSTNSKSIGLGDLDGDGDLDAFVTNTTYPTCCTTAGSVVSYLRNLGNGTFAPRVDYPSEPNGFGLLIKDLDGDGLIDVTTGNYSSAKYSTMKGRRGPGTMLSWAASSDLGGGSVAGYRVYREGVSIGTTRNLAYVDAGLAAGGHYHYTVSAYDNATPANESAQTPEVHIVVP